MKSVLMSIQPKWCELIASGKKTIEVRKSRPKLQTPFKCYIYCTKGNPLIFGDSKAFITDKLRLTKKYKNAPQEAGLHKWNGKVIGEFVCDKADRGTLTAISGYTHSSINITNTCLSMGELEEYLGIGCFRSQSYEKSFYGWHISALKIYDKPKELGEFTRRNIFKNIYMDTQITRPPQSWCYVETL